MWNGTAETLKANPTSRNTIARMVIRSGLTEADAIRTPISSRCVVPATA
jgi:hypothetical protein